MISLFQIAPNDQSVIYLGQIFGMISPDVLMPDSASMLFGVLFKVFNTSMLTLGAAIVIYTTIVGLLKTAQEGEFLGKQWSSLWVPLRTVFGIAALFPLPTGYSAIQVIFMWFIMQGVGAADSLWSAVINYNIIAGSPTAPQTGLGTMDLDAKMSTLFQGLVCQSEAHRNSVDIVPGPLPFPVSYYCHANSGKDFCKNPVQDPQLAISDDVSKNTYSLGPQDGGCGKLTYCLEQSAGNDGSGACDSANKKSAYQCAICQAQKKSLKQIIPVLAGIADKVAEADDDYVREKAYQQYGEAAKLVSLFTSGSGNYQTPQWIVNYCNDKGDSDIKDCVVNGPATYDGSTFSPDKYNVSKDAIKSLYFPYSITPFMTNNTAGSTASNATNFIQAVHDLYASTLSQVVTTIQNQVVNLPEGQGGNTWQRDAKNQGWIFAGGYFYKIISESKKNIDAGLPQLDVAAKQDSSDINHFRNNYNAAGNMLTEIRTAAAANTPGQNIGAVPSNFGEASGAIQDASTAIINAFMNCLNTDQNQAGSPFALTGTASKTTNNPLLSVATFGYQLMILAQLLFAALVTIVFFSVALATVNPIFMGNGLTMSPIGEAVKAVLGMISPLVVLLIATMYSMGAILGIYVPLIPFMIFSMGAIGWMLATIEAMVAAPVVALGILSPGGQNEILGRAEPALMLMLNLFLRPSLMVIGLMASTLVSIPAMKLINTTFLATIKIIMTNPGLFEQILFITFYSSFVVTVINKCYSLTYVIPERVLTWIGGQAVQYGEAEALQASKQAIEGGAQGTVGAGKEVGGHAAHAGGMVGQLSTGVKAKVKAKSESDAAAAAAAKKGEP